MATLSPTQEAEIAKIIAESKESLLKFSDYFLPHHKLDAYGKTVPPASIHHEFEELLRGAVGYGKGKSWYNLLAILPRGCAKSTIGGLIFTMWCTIFTNKSYIVIVGASEESVEDHFKNIKQEVQNNKLLHLIGVRPDPDGVNNSTHFDFIGPKYPGAKYADGVKKIRISAYSTSSFPRGKKAGARRPDLIIIDDLEVKKKGNKTGVENQNYRTEIKNIFEGDIIPSGFNDESMQIVMLGTIMHEAQLLNQLYVQNLKGEYYPPFKCIKYSMIEKFGTPHAYSIWPEKMTVEQFEKKLESAKANGTENIVYNEYLSLPTSPENIIFKRKDFKYFVDRAGVIMECDKDGNVPDKGFKINKRHTSIAVVTDLAFTIEKRSDYTAFAICACDNEKNVYILDIVYGKWLAYDVAKQADEIITKYNPVVLGVEANAGGKPVIEIMTQELRNNPRFFGITPLKTGSMSKHDRIINKLQLPYKHGKIYHNLNADYLQEYESQVLSVSRDGITALHDDLVDAVSYIYDVTDDAAIYNDNDYNEEYEDAYEGSSYI